MAVQLVVGQLTIGQPVVRQLPYHQLMVRQLVAGQLVAGQLVLGQLVASRAVAGERSVGWEVVARELEAVVAQQSLAHLHRLRCCWLPWQAPMGLGRALLRPPGGGSMHLRRRLGQLRH